MKQQSETEVNHFIYSFFSLSLHPTSLSLSLSFFNQVMEPGLWSKGEEIDGERITVKRID